MEDPEAEKVTSVHSFSTMEQSAGEKQPADLAAPEVEEAAGIVPQEEVAGGSPVVEVRLHSLYSTEGEEVDLLDNPAPRAELHTPSYAEGENVPGFEAACTGAVSNQLLPHAAGSEALVWLLPEDGFEPHSLPLLEDEQVPNFEAVQVREDPHRVSYTEEDEVLDSETLSFGVEHTALVLLEGGEASVLDAPSPRMEASLGPAQGGNEIYDESWKEDKTEPDIACAVGSDDIVEYDIEMAGDLAEATVNEFAGEANEFTGEAIEFAGEAVEFAGEAVEFAEEAVESAGEDAEAACSGDIASENEFPPAVDMKRRGGKKRKRGRPSSKLQGTRFPSQKKDEEEVCFICFDGGDLVVCDRRGCPKVYHPSCVNREEAYFQSKGQWSCGWHLCSKCQKSASNKCYTCTYSLCKLCVNEEEFTCIRGNKGFCTACMTTILLMETNENAKKKKDGVDFNDRSCWEYLFKDYWFELKAKLSMNLDELTKSRTASKVCDLDSGNEESSDDGQGASSDRSSACHDERISSKKKLKLPRNTTCKISRKTVRIEGLSPHEDTSRKRAKNLSRNATPNSLKKEEKTEVSAVDQEKSLMIKKKKRSRKTANEEDETESEWPVHKYKSSIKKSKKRSRKTDEKNDLLVDADKEQTTVAEYTDWASKELLEFISHVKNGDKSILSPYDVQELLLDYIKVNNLRDPRKKSQIICDAMLLTLFDKSRVAHFEMLKLLESHFLIKVSSPASVENQGGDKDPIQMGDEVSQDLVGMMITDKQRIARKIVESKPQTNLYCYAAIDAHNINLMYLRRSLMEDLIDDMSTFSEKVIGSFVRIRVTGSSQRQEVYRLVQVVGCGKAPEEYKTGRRTTDVMLEIINLDKKEVIAVDIISNQDFTEEECKRLRQSIKFGFISRLTVGEVQEKARVLQAVRISEHLESEKLRLTHLRDRASEKGRKKEHRECVEKLQLLSSPEEQMKRLSEVAQAHADPKMDPSYESPEDDGDEDEIKKGNPGRPIQSTFKESELISHRKEGSCNWSGAPKSPNNVNASHTNDEQNSNVETKKIVVKGEALLDNKEPARESTLLPEPKLEASPVKLSQPIAGENEKLWHYKDPSGKIQGPFSVVQLRKWSKHFPSNLAIWRKSERQENSILLTDALAGNLEKDLPEWLPPNSVNLSSPSLSTISSSKIQETLTSFQNDKAVGNASCTDSTANLDNKRSTGGNDFYQVSRHEQVIVAQAVNSGSTQQASYQLIDVHNRPPVISSELDPRKKFLEEPSITRGNGDNIQKQDLASHLNSNISNNHIVKAQSDKLVDNSTSSTESNTVPEVTQCDNTSTMSQKRGALDAKPIVESNAFESFSPQRSDTSTFTKPGPETPRSANANTLMQNPVTFANSANGPPSHLGPQTIVPCNWNQPTNTIIGEQPVLSLNSTTMLSGASAGVSTSVNGLIMPLVSTDGSKPFSSPQINNSMNAVNWNQPTNTIIGEQPVSSLNSATMLSGVSPGVSTSVNCQTMPLVSSDGLKPFSSPQMNNSMNAVNYQQLNMSWGTGTTESNNPGWQGQPQFQNLSNLAAAVGSVLCSTGVQGGLVNTNLGWGMMAQGNMSMPWVAPPNSNIAWNQGPALPPQGNASPNFIRPPPQGNVPSYPLWNSPMQVNPNQNPTWPAPPAANTIQITHDNSAPPRGPSMENPSSSSMPREMPRERTFGSRDSGFRGAGPGYGPGRQPRNWMSSGNAELPSRPPLELSGICFYFQKYGNCKRGASCKYIHSS